MKPKCQRLTLRKIFFFLKFLLEIAACIFTVIAFFFLGFGCLVGLINYFVRYVEHREIAITAFDHCWFNTSFLVFGGLLFYVFWRAFDNQYTPCEP